MEVDGPIHEYTAEEDAIRQEFLQSTGLRLIRFSNDEVITSPDVVLLHIAEIARTSPSPQSGEGVGG